MPEHLVMLIGMDGTGVPVKRTVATYASVLLRDLLDGVDDEPTGTPSSSGAVQSENVGSGSYTIDVPLPYFSRDILERCVAYMTYRYTQTYPNGNNATGHRSRRKDGGGGGSSVSSSVSGRAHGGGGDYGGGGDLSHGGAGRPRREIPRPMTQPLNEYLDAQERQFLADWDEQITVNMVKAATLLNCTDLINLSSAKLASYLLVKNVESMRTLLGVESDFTPQEEAELKKEMQTN